MHVHNLLLLKLSLFRSSSAQLVMSNCKMGFGELHKFPPKDAATTSQPCRRLEVSRLVQKNIIQILQSGSYNSTNRGGNNPRLPIDFRPFIGMNELQL